MIKFHQDFIRRKWWFKWNNWHCASNSQLMRNLSSKNVLSFDKRNCSNWQSYSCFTSEFHENINEHLLSQKNCCSNDIIYIFNLQRWKWCKNHWFNIDSLNYKFSYLWWIMTWHKWSWLNERNNDCHSHSCAVSSIIWWNQLKLTTSSSS